MELESLKNKRRTLKASCTRIKGYVDFVQDITDEMIAQLKVRKEKLELYWQQYDDVQSQIELIETGAEGSDRDNFEASYFNLIARIHYLLDSARSTRASQANAAAFNVESSQQANVNTHICLPKLNLPVFSGKYQEWTPFSQMFHTMITNNNRLTNIEKFQYLKSSLSRDPTDAIESPDELSDQNFEVAWNILEKRYDKLCIIVQAHIQSVLELPHIKKENYLELRQLLNVTTKHINALKALKRPVENWDNLIVHILGNKLDPLTFRDWEDTLSGHELSRLEQLMDFLMKKCQTLETIITKENASAIADKSNQSNLRKSIGCVATKNSKCSYCSGEHSIYFCQSFTKLPTGQRIVEVKKRNLCINCMRSKSHQAIYIQQL